MRKIYLVLLLIISTTRGEAMAFFDAGKVNIFSEVNGVLVVNGEVIDGAVVSRTVTWKGSEHEDSVTTKDGGKFIFPSMVKRDLTKFMPSEFTAFQKITVHYQDEIIKIWETVKREPIENGELEGSPLNLKCDLSDPSRFVHLAINSIETKCTW
jgi:hypothetical protein